MSQQPHRRRHRRYDPLLVLDYIATYQHRSGQQSPSQRRIQKELLISAPSVVHNLERRLVEAGLLQIVSHRRGCVAEVAITDAGQAALQQWRATQGRSDTNPDVRPEGQDGL